MIQLPSLSYIKVIKSLQRHGYVVVRQKGSHVRIQKRFSDGTIRKTTVPVHNPIKKNTLRKILKDADFYCPLAIKTQIYVCVLFVSRLLEIWENKTLWLKACVKKWQQ